MRARLAGRLSLVAGLACGGGLRAQPSIEYWSCSFSDFTCSAYVGQNVSPDGSTLLGLLFPSPLIGEETAAYIRKGESPVLLGTLEGEGESIADGSSADGSVIYVNSSVPIDTGLGGVRFPNRAARWEQATGLVELETHPDADSFRVSAVSDGSADGSVMVGYATIESDVCEFDVRIGSRLTEAVMWSADGTIRLLGSLAPIVPGEYRLDAAYGISADGSVVVGTSGLEAFRWTESSGMVGLGDLSGGLFGSVAFSVSADSSTIVGASLKAPLPIVCGFPSLDSLSTEAFVWTEANGMVGLGTLPGFPSSAAVDVTADGSKVIGTSFDEVGGFGDGDGFLWTPEDGMRPLTEALAADYGLDVGGIILAPAAISDDGSVIVGAFTDLAASTFGGFRIDLDLAGETDPIDFNEDGVLDIGDITSFVELFLVRDDAVELTGDGIIDTADIGQFVDLFLEATG